jgi:predicted HAD superfamily Cof-like phosphohydrolase
MELNDLESKVIELLTRMERVVMLQENVDARCAERMERFIALEKHEENLDKRISALEEQAKDLGGMISELNTENKKLCRLIKSMIALLCLTLAALSLVGIEAFPFLFEMVKKLVM